MQLQVGAAPFIKGATLQLEPNKYTNSHLRRQTVMFVCNLVEYLYPLLHVYIKDNYGHARLSKTQYKKKERAGTLTPDEKRDFNEPGPFSLVTYLEAFLDKRFYGDGNHISIDEHDVADQDNCFAG